MRLVVLITMSYPPAFLRVCFTGLILMLTFLDRGFSQVPLPDAPTEKTEVVDTTKPPLRTLWARISLSNRYWNEQQQRAAGPAVIISFGGAAAPLENVGKVVQAGEITMSPEVAGEWKWERANRLVFTPTTGWLPPGKYQFKAEPGLLAADCKLADRTDFNGVENAPQLTARFSEKTYYIDPATPDLQQLVTTVTFSQPVPVEELRKRFSVTSVTGIEIFQAGSQAQILTEPKNPLKFYLRSPLMKPGAKEDLILFSIQAGLKAVSGGDAIPEPFETKLTAYGKDSVFFIDSVGNMLRKTSEGEPEQAILMKLSIPARSEVIAGSIKVFKLPPELKDKRGRIVLWTKDNITDEILAKAEEIDFELVTMPDAAPMESAMALRVAQQPGCKILVTVPGNTAGPGGFVTPEEFRGVTSLPLIPREAVDGEGGTFGLKWGTQN